MKLNLSHGDRDVLDLDVKVTWPFSLAVSTRVWTKHPKPASASEPAKDPGPNLRASGHLASSERGWTPQPDTHVFGFNRRRT